MKNDKKADNKETNNALDWATSESMLERWVDLIVNWTAAVVGLGFVLLTLPLFALVDLYRWFKFKVFRKE